MIICLQLVIKNAIVGILSVLSYTASAFEEVKLVKTAIAMAVRIILIVSIDKRGWESYRWATRRFISAKTRLKNWRKFNSLKDVIVGSLIVRKIIVSVISLVHFVHLLVNVLIVIICSLFKITINNLTKILWLLAKIKLI